MATEFDYTTAFSRNIGWLTNNEQALLRRKRVAIAGLGGVGGSHLLTLVRLGVGAFNVADLDTFELANFNRQAGASLRTIGKEKVKTLTKAALAINPDLDIRVFEKGIGPTNNYEFLKDVDLYLDGLDFFAVAARRAIFAACHELQIPAVTAAPLGLSSAVLSFLPENMSFEQYFRLEGHSEHEQLLRFFVGLAPAGLHRHALVDPTTIDLSGHRGPSTAIGCELCAGAAAGQVLKILLNRGKIWPAPHALQFDSYSNKLAHTWRPGGNNHPLQRLALNLARKKFLANNNSGATTPTDSKKPQTPTERILDLARWAPSGDNTQPWRFEILTDNHFVVHGSDTRDWCVYDLDGQASQIAVGALLQNIRIAASGEGMDAKFSIRENTPEPTPLIDVRLVNISPDEPLQQNQLLSFIRSRVTQRRPFSTRPLRPVDRKRLEEAVSAGYRVVWLDQPAQKRDMARLLFRNAHIRLTIPEAYEVHRRIIEWDSRFSKDRIPDQAVGLDTLNLKTMRWAMQSWDRIVFLNRYFAGTILPRIMLDLLPGRRCAAHFFIVADKEPTSLPDYLEGGMAMQRFWLTAASLGLQYQPEMTPLIFSNYVRGGRRFTKDSTALKTAETLKDQLSNLIGEQVLASTVFMGRIGYGKYPSSRSERLPLEQLMKKTDPTEPLGNPPPTSQ